jgi:hypothetical protein
MVLVANGNTNAAIGRLLGISRVTVDRHLADAYAALGARDRANAVGLAIRRREIDVDGDIQAPEAAQGSVTLQKAAGGPQGAQEAANGARDVRGAPKAAQSRSGDFGEAAA